MDPLTSAIAIVTLSAQSCKQTFNLISGLTNAPQSITHTRQLLMQTDECLIALEQLLVNNKKSSVLYSALRESSLDKALKSTRDICSDFGAAVTDVTKHSTDTRFSTRDRVLVHTKEAKIDRFNRQLGDCRTTLITVISAINMALANRACVGVEHLNDSAKAQETALAKVDTYLRNPSSNQSAQNKQTEAGMNLIRNPSSNQSAQNRQTETGSNLIPSRILQETCKETLGATKAKRRVQRFVDMMVDDSSIAMQGVVGDPKEEVEQVFGKMTVTKQSRAFQGQMSEEAFATMFGADSWNPVK